MRSRIRRLRSRALRAIADRRALAVFDASRPLGRALRRARDGATREEDREAFARIGSLRAEIARSDASVRHLYYGEGSDTRGATREELARGVVVEESVGAGVERVSVRSARGELLYHAARELLPATVLELGTGYGISGLYWLHALARNGRGHLHSIDGSPEHLRIAAGLFERVAPGRFTTHGGALQDVLPAVLERIPAPELVFVDADHSYEGTLDSFHTLLPATAPEGVLLFDDVRWSDDMQRAWREIRSDPDVADAAEFRGIGICVRT